jgi:hypothetical protein
MCNVCLKATTPGYARLECMSCDVVVHRYRCVLALDFYIGNSSTIAV